MVAEGGLNSQDSSRASIQMLTQPEILIETPNSRNF